MQRQSKIRIGYLAAAAVGITLASAGLAKAAPRPVTAKQERLVDPPMPDLLPALTPAPVARAVDNYREKRRHARMPASERAVIAAAEAKRARRNAKRAALARAA